MKALLRPLTGSLVIALAFFTILELLGRWRGFKPETWSALDGNLGWRMNKPAVPADDAATLLLIGDSIAYVADPAAPAFPNLISQSGEPVFNLSAIGYGTDQEVLSLAAEKSRLPKTIRRVVLNFCLFNDFVNNLSAVNVHDGYRPKPVFGSGPDGLVLYRDHLDFPPAAELALWINQRSGAVYLLRGWWARARLPAKNPTVRAPFMFGNVARRPDEAEFARYEEATELAFPVTRALLERAAETAQQEWHADFLILLHPGDFSPAADNPLALSKSVHSFFSGLSVPSYDLGCHYRRRGLHFSQIATDPVGHLSEEGHREVARVIQSPAEALPGDCRLGSASR